MEPEAFAFVVVVADVDEVVARLLGRVRETGKMHVEGFEAGRGRPYSTKRATKRGWRGRLASTRSERRRDGGRRVPGP